MPWLNAQWTALRWKQPTNGAELRDTLLQMFDTELHDQAKLLAQNTHQRFPEFVEALRMYQQATAAGAPPAAMTAYQTHLQRHREFLTRHLDVHFWYSLALLNVIEHQNAWDCLQVIADVSPDSTAAAWADVARETRAIRHQPKAFSNAEVEGVLRRLHSLVHQGAGSIGNYPNVTSSNKGAGQGGDAAQADLLLVYLAALICYHDTQKEPRLDKESLVYFDQLADRWQRGSDLFRYVYGQALVRDYRYSDALPFARRSAEIIPWPVHYLLIGNAASGLNRHDEAVAAYRRGWELADDKAFYWARIAAVLGFAGRLEESLDAAQKAVDLNPNAAYHWSQLVLALERLERPVEAAAAALDGAQRHPGSDLQRHSETLQFFRDAAASAANSASAVAPVITPQADLERQVVSLLAIGDHSAAMRLARQHHETARAIPLAIQTAKTSGKNRLADFAARNRTVLDNEVGALFLLMVLKRAEFDTDTSAAGFALLKELAAPGPFQQTVQLMAELDRTANNPNYATEDQIQGWLAEYYRLCQRPDTSPLQIWLGGIQCRQHGEWKDALVYFQHLSQLWPDGPAWMHNTYANVLDDADHNSHALHRRRLALQQMPDAWWIHQGASHTLRHLKRFDESLQMIDQALAIRPTAASCWSSRAHCQLQAGDFAAAIESAQTAIKHQTVGGDMPHVPWLNWGKALEGLEQPGNAYEIYSRGLEKHPGNRQLERQRDRVRRFAPQTRGNVRDRASALT